MSRVTRSRSQTSRPLARTALPIHTHLDRLRLLPWDFALVMRCNARALAEPGPDTLSAERCRSRAECWLAIMGLYLSAPVLAELHLLMRGLLVATRRSEALAAGESD